MRLLKSTVHPDVVLEQGSSFLRQAARGIVLDGDQILLMYTARYDDFSLPGGGVDANESIEQGLIRELAEETGARNVRNLQEFGLYEEFRPWYKPDYDYMQMHSYCYLCDIDAELDEPQFEDYELNNGMQVVWKNIFDAIAHNKQVIANSPKKGLSIERETYLLELIAQELVLPVSCLETQQAA